jgi:hypothetical protein
MVRMGASTKLASAELFQPYAIAICVGFLFCNAVAHLCEKIILIPAKRPFPPNNRANSIATAILRAELEMLQKKEANRHC